MEIHGKIQKWLDSIISDDLEGVAREVEALEDCNLDTKANKLVFRALLCLSHTAERSKPSQIQIGKDISKITDALCYSLTEIPDLMKFYSCLYHIARKLIAMQLYSEAMQASAWTFPGNLVFALTDQHLDMYPKIANLWHEAIIQLIDTSPRGISKTEQKLILEFLKNELKVLDIIVKERTVLVLSRILRLLTKFDAVLVDAKYKGNPSHRQIVRDFLEKFEVFVEGVEKYDIYYDALRFVNSATAPMAASFCVKSTMSAFTENCKIVEKIFSLDTELLSSLMIYNNMGIMLLQSVDESNVISHWDIDRITKETSNLLINFKDGKGASCNMRMIGFVLQHIFDRWEERVINGNHLFLTSAMLREVLSLLKLMFFVLNSVRTKNCEVCRENACRMNKNIHTVTVVSIRCFVLLSKIFPSDTIKDTFLLVRQILEENVAAIFEMKESSCAQWFPLWNNCGIIIYNLSVTCHKLFYEETVFLFSLLCSCIVKFEGINATNSMINIKNPLSHALHRLSSIHFLQKKYREALTPCALNGLLSYQNSDSKAFRMWANIKHACANSASISKITMLSCLREDMDVISEIGIIVRLEDYNLKELYLQELRGLHDARSNMSLSMKSALDELETMNYLGLEYAQGVQLFGYHMLHYQYDEDFTRYMRLAEVILKKVKDRNDLYLLASASLDFYSFIKNLNEIVKLTKAEMETAKFALRATKSVTNEGQPKNTDGVVPAYTKINVTQDSILFKNLQQALSKWSLCLKKNLFGIVKEWQLVLTLRTIVIVAEYSRVHRFSTLETEAWELAYKLASQLSDHRTCVYVTGRSLSLRKVNNDWINTGNELTTKLKALCDLDAENAIALFWVSLSNLNFETGKHEEATEILRRVSSLPSISPLKNVASYLTSMDTFLRNYYLCSSDNRSTKYMVYMVRCLYSMLTLMDYSPQPRIGVKEKQLYGLEVLFTCTSRLALRMNSILSFKEISSHIINRLKLSQSSGIALRVADCLKNLCFIDLSRMQLDDCVVKLQGLESILKTEYIGESRNTKNPKTSTNELNKPGARDSRVNDTSPILRKTIFKTPDFVTHSKCDCYKCSSIDYQYLVLSATHIRAQLYFLQGYLDEALEHFNGTFCLRRIIIQRHRRIPKSKERKESPWKCCDDVVEYVLLLITFSRLIRELEIKNNSDAINIAVEAVDLCQRFHLNGHPIYVAAKELVLEYQFCGIFKDNDFNEFTVPDPSSIDINKFTQTASIVDSSAIVTPTSKLYARKPRTIRRNKTPPLLKLTKVSMILSDEEDEAGSESPKSSRQRTKTSRVYRLPKSVRRKKLEKYLDSSPEPPSSTDDDSDAAGSSSLKIAGKLSKMKNEQTVETSNDQGTLSQIITMAASLPNLSKELNEILDKRGIDDSDKIQLVIKLVEQHERNAEPKNEAKNRKAKNSTNAKSRLVNRNQDEVEDKLVTCFKKILIESEDAKKIDFNDRMISQNVDERSSKIPAISINNFTPSFVTDNERRNPPSIIIEKEVDIDLCIDDETSVYSESISSADIKTVVKLLKKPEHVQQKERLRTSDRIKRSRVQSGEIERKKSNDSDIVPNLERCQSIERKGKPKSSARTRVKSLQNDGLDGLLSLENGETDRKTQGKQKSLNLRRIEKLQLEIGAASSSSSSSGKMESFQLDNSDLVPTSDIEEKAIIDERRNNGSQTYGTRICSRITRSRTQINGRAYSKSKSIESSNSVLTSDPEESIPQATRLKNSGQKNRSRASNRAK